MAGSLNPGGVHIPTSKVVNKYLNNIAQLLLALYRNGLPQMTIPYPRPCSSPVGYPIRGEPFWVMPGLQIFV